MIIMDISIIQILQFVLAIVLPLLVGLVTKKSTDPGIKAVLLLALAGVSSFLAELVSALTSETVFNMGTALLFTLGTFVTGVAMHYGFWTPTNVTAKVQDTLVTDNGTKLRLRSGRRSA